MALDSETVTSVPKVGRNLRALSGLAALVLVLVILGLPITTFWKFLLFVLAVMLLAFGNVDLRPRRWAVAVGNAAVVVVIAQVLPSPRIQEGHNVFIPVMGTLPVFETGLPAAAFNVMKAEFDRTYFEQTDGLPGSPDWWDNRIFTTPAFSFTKKAFAPSADALWQKPKYSRIVDEIGFTKQDQARIGAINAQVYNFYGKARIDRSCAARTRRTSCARPKR